MYFTRPHLAVEPTQVEVILNVILVNLTKELVALE